MLLAELRGADALQFGVVECALHQRLAVVEAARHAQRAHVVAEGAELVRLARRDPAIGIEDHHAQAGDPVEGAADRGAGIARWPR
jgi:hypothetical protein